MMMSSARYFSLLAMTLVVLFMVGCSSGEKKPEYYDAEETATLEIPEDLDRPASSSALLIHTPAMPPPSMVMETKPPRVTNTTSGLGANSRLNWSAQGLYLLVEDSPESAHRRLRLVIERAGMQRVRIDDQGVYRFDYYQTFDDAAGFFKKMAFWSRDKSEDYSGAYQTYIRPDGESARVYIKYADGTDCEPDAAEHLLAVLSSRLG